MGWTAEKNSTNYAAEALFSTVRCDSMWRADQQGINRALHNNRACLV